MATHRHYKWLLEESAVWVADGLISAEQAEKLRDRYPAANTKSWGLYLLSAIGAIVFGLGVILFFAYNWSDLSKYVKLAIIFLALLLAHGIAILVSMRNPDNANLKEGFHLLGTMMFGAGIWLIAQIYHIDEHYPNAFAFWGLGALAFAWVLPSIIQGLLATILLTTWGIAEVADFDAVHYPSNIVLILGVITLAWIQKSRTLLFFGMTATLFLFMMNLLFSFDAEVLPYLLLAVATLLICAARISRFSNFPASGDVLRSIGICIYGFLLLITTFETITDDLIKYLPEGSAYVLALSALGVAIVCWTMLSLHLYRIGIPLSKTVELVLVLLSLITLSLFLTSVFENKVAFSVLLLNAILAAHCVLLIIVGTDELNWRHVAVGCLTLTLLIYLRFNDLFQSLLMRSLVFLVVGAILFFIGHIYSKQASRKLADQSVNAADSVDSVRRQPAEQGRADA